MRNKFTAAVSVLCVGAGLAVPTEAAFAGCVKGALVGGVIGHFAGHHGVLGALAGCAYGHHQSYERQKHAHYYGDSNNYQR